MLLYHPLFDARHCVFRMLRLLEPIGNREVEFQRLRIWDFYLLFPEALAPISLPRARGNQALKRVLDSYQNRYDIMPDAKRVFARMEPIQKLAVNDLAAKNLIDAQRLKGGKIARTATPLPEELAALIRERNSTSEPLISFLTTAFLNLPLYGHLGVRERTDLFDNRYDLQIPSPAS